MRFFLCALCLTGCLFTVAQPTKKPAWKPDPSLLRQHKWAATFLPFALVQTDLTILPGVEYALDEEFRLTADAGYIFNSVMSRISDENPARGFIFRPGIKWFSNPNSLSYWLGQAFYKQVDRHTPLWVNQGGGAFQQLENVVDRRTVYGFNIIAGLTQPWSRKTRKVFFDGYIGVGIRWRKTGIVGQPYAPSFNRRGFALLDGEGVLPSLPAGFRLVYIF